MLVSYEYYRDTYRGNRLTENDFARLERRASSYVTGICAGRLNEQNPPERAKDAICAIAEEMHKIENGGVLASASNDGYTETYATVGPLDASVRYFSIVSEYLRGTNLLSLWA